MLAEIKRFIKDNQEEIILGVAIILVCLYIFSLFLGEMSPVRSIILEGSIFVDSMNSFLIWFERGFVGEQRRILDSGNLFSLSTDTAMLIFVLPRPVGSTTKVLLFLAVSTIFF